MKLGTQTGSLFNHIMSNNTIKEIVPGVTGATLLSWSDRHAATVIETFKKGKYDYIVVQQDIATRVDNLGMSDAQSYTYERNPEGPTYTFRITEKGFQGVYANPETGRFLKCGGGLTVGQRAEYYDFSF